MCSPMARSIMGRRRTTFIGSTLSVAPRWRTRSRPEVSGGGIRRRTRSRIPPSSARIVLTPLIPLFDLSIDVSGTRYDFQSNNLTLRSRNQYRNLDLREQDERLGDQQEEGLRLRLRPLRCLRLRWVGHPWRQARERSVGCVFVVKLLLLILNPLDCPPKANSKRRHQRYLREP